MIWLYLLTSVSIAQECKTETRIFVPSAIVADLTCAIAKGPLQEFMKRADPCVSKDLLSMEIDFPLCMKGMGLLGSKSKPVPIEKLEQLSNEIVRPTRFNKMYGNSLNRPELAKLLNDIAQNMRKNSVKYIGCDDLRSIAASTYTEAKEKKRIGECYQIQTFGGVKYVFGTVAREVSVSLEQQKSIEDLFSTQKPYHLDMLDSELVLKKRLSMADLKELQAIRKASELFEKATPLKNDEAGGFFSNLKGEFTGGDQLNCVLEASTHLVFLKTLASKGLIKKFEVVGTIVRQPDKSKFKKDLLQSGHVAVLLRSRETGQEVVYDSWFEKGGDAAHILMPDDWQNLSLDFKNDFRDIVPLLPTK